MYHRIAVALVLGLGMSMPSISQASGNEAQIDAKQIAQKLFDRDDGMSQVTLQTFSTCRYGINAKKKRGCVEKPRRKVIESLRKDYGERQKDVKSLSIVKSPAAERGMGFLQYDYEDPEKDADQWMYLSAMGKVKRIVSGNENEPNDGSFFGTEFSYEDMQKTYLDDYTYRLIKTTTYRKRPCWVLEITPTKEHARSSNYQKTVHWVDQERHVSLKAVLYDRKGNKVKQITSRNIKQINDVWVAMMVSMDNVQTKRMTTLKVEKTALNMDLKDDSLILRMLTDGAFRENRLNSYREYIN